MNKQIEKLLKDTHSDDRHKIFTKTVYERIKSEKTFKAFIYSEIDKDFLDDVKKGKLKNYNKKIDEVLHNIPFFDNNHEKLEASKLEKLRSKFAKVELIMQLLNLTQSKILNNGFLQCFTCLHDPANVFVGEKPSRPRIKKALTRMETLNSIYGRYTDGSANVPEFS